jgi:hypothetical protein
MTNFSSESGFHTVPQQEFALLQIPSPLIGVYSPFLGNARTCFRVTSDRGPISI